VRNPSCSSRKRATRQARSFNLPFGCFQSRRAQTASDNLVLPHWKWVLISRRIATTSPCENCRPRTTRSPHRGHFVRFVVPMLCNVMALSRPNGRWHISSYRHLLPHIFRLLNASRRNSRNSEAFHPALGAGCLGSSLRAPQPLRSMFIVLGTTKHRPQPHSSLRGDDEPATHPPGTGATVTESATWPCESSRDVDC
jgi:hypothetical protein